VASLCFCLDHGATILAGRWLQLHFVAPTISQSKGFSPGARGENVVVISDVIGLFASFAPIVTLMTQEQMQLECPIIWRGSAFGGARGRTDVPKIVEWYMNGKIDIDSLITHTMPIEKINDAFDLMHAGQSIRSVVTF
jgi:threonine dehydrogenase-like Zn-dependent dehydrogenase